MLFNEPKLLKFDPQRRVDQQSVRFSALQRAEIAEMFIQPIAADVLASFSALQRAEIAEIQHHPVCRRRYAVFQCSSTSRNC